MWCSQMPEKGHKLQMEKIQMLLCTTEKHLKHFNLPIILWNYSSKHCDVRYFAM